MNTRSKLVFKRKVPDQYNNKSIDEIRSERRTKRKREREDFIAIQIHNIVKMKIFNGNDMIWKMTFHERRFCLLTLNLYFSIFA